MMRVTPTLNRSETGVSCSDVLVSETSVSDEPQPAKVKIKITVGMPNAVFMRAVYILFIVLFFLDFFGQSLKCGEGLLQCDSGV